MKPADHPDFFRFPAPAGRSRESRIVLDERGRFWNDGVLIEHAAASRAFASWLDLHPDDGRFILTNGYDWTYLEVVDAPFIVTHVEVRPQQVSLTLSDGTEEPLDPSGVCIGRGAAAAEGAQGSRDPVSRSNSDASAPEVLYARVKGGRFEARFSARAQAQAVELLVEGPDAVPMLQVAGQLHGLGERRQR